MAKIEPQPSTPQAIPASERFLNCSPGFWDTYRMRTGSPRRQALMALFQAHPTARLPVNNHCQASTADTDLALLVRRGLLKRIRDMGVRRQALNKSSIKRQTFLVLV